MMVRREAPQHCSKCQSTRIVQDEDVLDTWFSSWLWPFSTMGWPEDTPELKYFYPTHTLVTAPDIIFFWVARMIMSGLEFMGDVPFRHVYFNGLIRDAQGRKMSKTLGNGIDPLQMVEKYSADAVRFSLLMLTSEGQDINLAESNFEIGRNFSNKLWNAYRFLALSFDEQELPRLLKNGKFLDQADGLQLADRWILSRLHRTIAAVTKALDEFHLNEAVDNLYSFFWREFCDWYLELIKPRLYGKDQAARDLALGIGIHVLRNVVQLLHPVIPFITEEIWHGLKLPSEPDIIVSSWPVADQRYWNDEAEKDLGLLQQLIGSIRNIRGEMNVPPSKQAHVLIKSSNPKHLALIEQNQVYLTSLARLSDVVLGSDLTKPRYSASSVVADLEIFMPLEGLIDIEVERNRLTKEIVRLEKQIEAINAKLLNQDFLAKAPKEVVDRERQKCNDFQANVTKLKANLRSLEG